MTATNPAERIAVVGTSGAGKTTLAESLARRIGAKHIELDEHYWQANWTPRCLDDFRQRIDDLTRESCWVCDGNYSVVRDIVWRRATTVVWLNYPLRVVFGRALRRTLLRCSFRKQLYGGNRETFWKSFFSRDSILLWAIRTHAAHRREYPRQFAVDEHSHLRIVELRSELEARNYLASLNASE